MKANKVLLILVATLLKSFVVSASLLLTKVKNVHRFSVDNMDYFREEPDFSAVRFSFAKHFQNHMVLQQAPSRANIYGFSPTVGAQVILSLVTTSGARNYNTTVLKGTSGVGVWGIMLDPIQGSSSPVSLRAESDGESVQLEDVLFGDVWLCSGQSNMQFTVSQIFGAADVIADSTKYPNVRFMNVLRQSSPTPLDDLIGIDQNWTPPVGDAVASFSAVCWLYGRAINKALGYPIGLIGTNYGGTPIKCWSSPVALSKCGVTRLDEDQYNSRLDEDQYNSPLFEIPDKDSVLWNSMVHPLLQMTIYGAIWYQGEQDSTSPEMMNKYNCTFPAMIDDWRLNFHLASSGQTSSLFPFGFVQLAPSMPPQEPGFPDIRWHQTADVGFVPNSRLPLVFMATALDLPDFDSPSGPVHTRFKQEVGFRLALSGLSVAYNQQLVFMGPFPRSAVLENNSTLVVSYGSQWTLNIRSTEGFELLCSSGNHSSITWWLPTSITSFNTTQVTLLASVCGAGQQVLGLRYLWQTTPCALKTCAVYSLVNELPAAPFVALAKESTQDGQPVFQFQ